MNGHLVGLRFSPACVSQLDAFVFVSPQYWGYHEHRGCIRTCPSGTEAVHAVRGGAGQNESPHSR